MAGTVASNIPTYNVGKEVVVLEDTSNGDVYTSRKFNTIQAGAVFQNEPSSSGSAMVSFSGNEATIYASTSGTFTLQLWGE